MKFEIGIDIRKEILTYSLILENFTSIFLATLLGIKNHESTKSFGNQGGSLSFNQKVDLLIDIGALDKIEKKKFITFMEIRNQFVHNYNAKDYQSCFQYLEGKETFVLKLYPQDKNLSKEEQLRGAVLGLAENVVSITVNLLEKVKEKYRKEVENDLLQQFKKDSLQAITDIEKIFNDLFQEKKKNKKSSISIEELLDLGSQVRKVYFAMMIQKFKKNK